uniref:Uncharacterized protein n=1 Tax=Palpitomonas bilix TaxID=652834 RepID=A0A7S3D604_9EUKA|mmetsp:Transcript_23792/g.60075  ORF Transcript_23792/g.60075 Transcript_23792/m.60075 type:complete len:656 (+) Transcript_23792:148-2115(+)|eukprot:CAMPEP_0113875262 /NCGR_PEP_ID=MMETSP0780_2-20120614/4846_1 /TAXON_ID=652834 /ORGANISM="Palpitomonas bilix" /LENGTH=655 /DNA_ID=CAMNT_0000861235 /DNA_START=148 /DNA_END=2115 /DNA_ORIENTATION=- /assembly_acc=CAM_ASM_000599
MSRSRSSSSTDEPLLGVASSAPASNYSITRGGKRRRVPPRLVVAGFYIGFLMITLPPIAFAVLRAAAEAVIQQASPVVLSTFLHDIEGNNFTVGVDFILNNPFPLSVATTFSSLSFDIPTSPSLPIVHAGKGMGMYPPIVYMSAGNNTLRASLTMADVKEGVLSEGVYKCVTGDPFSDTCWVRLTGMVSCSANILGMWLGPGPVPFSFAMALQPLGMGQFVSLLDMRVQESGAEGETMFHFHGALTFHNPSTLHGVFPALPMELLLPTTEESFANVTMEPFVLGEGDNALGFSGLVNGEQQKANESVFFVRVIEGLAVDVVAKITQHGSVASNWLQEAMVGVPMTIHVYPKNAIDLQVEKLVFISDNETIKEINIAAFVNIANPTAIIGNFSYMEMELYSMYDGEYSPVSSVIMHNFSLVHGSRSMSAMGIIHDDENPAVKEMLDRFMNSNPSHCKAKVTQPLLLRGFEVSFDLPGLPGNIIGGLALNLDGSSFEEILSNFSAQGEACIRNPLTFPISVESFDFKMETDGPPDKPDERVGIAHVVANSTYRVHGMREAILPLYVPAMEVTTMSLNFPLLALENVLKVGEYYLESSTDPPSCGPMCLLATVREGLIGLRVGNYYVTLPFGCEFQPAFCNVSMTVAFDSNYCSTFKP